MVKPTSNRPTTSKRVQTRPSVQDNVIQRIAELRNSGIGFRRISRQLKKEGLATISKSTVATYSKQTKPPENDTRKKPFNNPKLKALAKTEAKLQSQVNCQRIVTQAGQRVRNLGAQWAENPEVLQKIFKKKSRLKEFALKTLQDSQVLKAFKLHCRTNRLPLAETLANVVGPLEEFVMEKEDLGGHLDLPSYIEGQLDVYLMDEKQRARAERQEQLQKNFPAFLLNFKCPYCNAPYETMTIDRPEGNMRCKCGKRFKLLCIECRSKLEFDADKGNFFCRKCNMIFKRPTLSYSDYIFIRAR